MRLHQKAALMIRSLMRDLRVDSHIVMPKGLPLFSSQAVLSELDEDPMKGLIRTMFEGWKIREASYVRNPEAWVPVPGKDGQMELAANVDFATNLGEYTKGQEESMIEAAGGDHNLGLMLHYFGHWSNDIQSLAAEAYGIYIGKDFEILDCPPRPSEKHYWNIGVNGEPGWQLLEEVPHG